jgi:hypothetical protein
MRILEKFDQEAPVVLMLNLLSEIVEAAIVPRPVRQLIHEGADLTKRLTFNSLIETTRRGGRRYPAGTNRHDSPVAEAEHSEALQATKTKPNGRNTPKLGLGPSEAGFSFG